MHSHFEECDEEEVKLMEEEKPVSSGSQEVKEKS